MTLREEIEAAGITLPVRVDVYEGKVFSQARIVDADGMLFVGGLSPAEANLIARALNAAGEASDAAAG